MSLIGLLGLTSQLPADQLTPLLWLLWVMAVLTMTVGNVLGLLQDNVKRVLAYSSVAHSGYMLVGLLTAVVAASKSDVSQAHLGNGIAALLVLSRCIWSGDVGRLCSSRAVWSATARKLKHSMTWPDWVDASPCWVRSCW